MKNLNPALQAHLDTGATTMCYCWKVTRTDGVVQGFTNHDEDLTVDGQLYKASSGFTASQIQSSLGLAVDNLNADGALSDDSINEQDLAAGRYDDAEVELRYVNWADPTQFTIRKKGSMGEVKRKGIAFSAELRSQAHRLNQSVGRTYQRYCDARVGDARCGVQLDTATFKGTGSVLSASNHIITANGIDSFETNWFSSGLLTFTSGDNNGLSFEVKRHLKTSAGVVTVELWETPALTVNSTDSFTITAGCPGSFDVCRDKFNNAVNFRGFYFIPGNDLFQNYPNKGQSNLDGGSLYGNNQSGFGDFNAL